MLTETGAWAPWGSRPGQTSHRDTTILTSTPSGLQSPTREELIDFDRKRKPKKLSNKEWEHPVDPDARVAKMKDGATDMAHSAKCAKSHFAD